MDNWLICVIWRNQLKQMPHSFAMGSRWPTVVVRRRCPRVKRPWEFCSVIEIGETGTDFIRFHQVSSSQKADNVINDFMLICHQFSMGLWNVHHFCTIHFCTIHLHSKFYIHLHLSPSAIRHVVLPWPGAGLVSGCGWGTASSDVGHPAAESPGDGGDGSMGKPWENPWGCRKSWENHEEKRGKMMIRWSIRVMIDYCILYIYDIS